MKIFNLALTIGAAHSLGWTLFHFLWEGLALALAFALVLFFLPARAARARYAAGCLALAAMALAPVVTFLSIDRTAGGPSLQSVARPVVEFFSGRMVSSEAGGGARAGLANWSLEPAMPWLACLWLGGVALMALRLGAGWRRLRRLWTTQLAAMDPHWLERLEELKERLGVTRPVRLFRSALVEAPGVIGWLRPVILIPVSVLSGLTPAQLETILAHELAHIRRNDYLVNLAQNLLETVLFYHPAVWWVSRCVREEREHCCDDLAVEVCGCAETYARALASLEEIRSLPGTLALAADGGPLLARIRRLIEPAASTTPVGSKRRRLFWGVVLATVVGATLWTWELSGASFPFRFSLYQATARIALIPGQEEASGAERSSDGSLGSRQSVRLEAERIRSRSVLYPMIDDMKLREKWSARDGQSDILSEEQVFAKLLRRVQITVVPDTRILSITVRSENPKEAAEIANSIVEHYRDIQEMNRHGFARRRMDVFQALLHECEQEIHDANIALDNDPHKGEGWKISDRLDLLKSQRAAWLKKIQETRIAEPALSSVELLDQATFER
jgi:beta-lactamase regulating signal transducer with metallopeptidase domain